MKPLYIKISIILCTLFLWTSMSMADSMNPNVVIPIGFTSGNDNDASVVSSLVVNYNTNNDVSLPQPLTLLGKWDVTNNGWDGGTLYGFNVSFDDDKNTSGTWSASASDVWDTEDPLYYSLKAGNGFGLWYANGLFSEVPWDTFDLETKELSHISFWTAGGNTNPVPEPATLALVGLGLAGIAGYRRKRHSS